MTKAKVPSIKKAVLKPRNAGTMTEGQFWQWIYVTLRRKSQQWKPIRNTLLSARRISQSSNPRLKWEYQCSQCSNWHPGKEVVVDHKHGTGGMVGRVTEFINALFCEEDKLRVLCKSCHAPITKAQKAVIKG